MGRLGVLLVMLCFACGGASTQSVTVKTQASVIIEPTPRELPFNPRGARLGSASRQLAELAGHPIELRLDAAIVPELRSSFEDAVIDAFTSMARDLNDLKRVDAGAFSFGVEKLTRVEVRYDAARREDDISLDEVHRALIIRGPATRDALVERGVVYDVLHRAYDNDEARRYNSLRPENVPPEQRFDYFRWLVNDTHVRRDRSRSSASSSDFAEQTLKVLRLCELDGGRDRRLAEKSAAWLVGQGGTFTREYAHNPKTVMALPSGSVFHQAATAWARWAISAYPNLAEDDRMSIARALFMKSFNADRPLTHRTYPPFAWPGVDLFAFGLGEVDRWRASGHPTQLTKPPCSTTLDFIVCTRVSEPESGTSISPHCDEDWYRYTFETQRNRQRLAQAMTSRKDPIFTETVFKNVASSGSSITARPLDILLVLLRDVESDAASWAIGWRILVDEYVSSSFDIFVLEETRRLWVSYPERRGLLLSGLARMDRGERGNVDWKGFASAFGNAISMSEFSDYLNIDSEALYDAYLVWSALGHGWSRAALIVPKIDGWRKNSERRASYASNAYQSLQRTVGEMCREKAVKDLALMQRYFEAHKQAYSGLVEATRERQCQPPPPPPAPRNEVVLSPLKQGLPPLRIIQTGAE